MSTECDKSTQKSFGSAIRGLFVLLGNIFFIFLILLVACMVFFLIQNKISGGVPKVFGHQMYIVLSGSMNPTFDTGSTVFVKPKEPEEIQPGDVITFTGLDDKRSLTTHRVVDIDRSDPQNIQFITKGDANEVTDPSPVSGDRLVGTVSFAIPYLGYLLNYGQTKQGMLVLVIVPGVFLILTELHKLYAAAKISKEEEEASASETTEEKEAREKEENFNSGFWH
jgi:signal peptidase